MQKTLLIMLACALVTGCGSTSKKDLEALHKIYSLDAPLQNIHGPKRTIAVGKFDTIGSLSAKYGDWDIGGGMAAMLTAALVDTRHFMVLERAELDKILNEQQMAGEGVSAEGSGPDLGQLYGAQLLIFGAVTKFGDDFTGGGVSLGAAGVGSCAHALASGSFAAEHAKGAIGMDIRIVDSTTGAVIDSVYIEAPITKRGKDTSLEYGKFSIGGNKFMRTPIGDAARKAISHVVLHVAEAAGNLEWVGRVVEIEGATVFVNAGQKSEVTVGDRFIIEHITKRFTDPVTSRLLGIRKETLGFLEVDVVDEEMAYGTYQPISEKKPQRNDLVLLDRD